MSRMIILKLSFEHHRRTMPKKPNNKNNDKYDSRPDLRLTLRFSREELETVAIRKIVVRNLMKENWTEFQSWTID